MKVRSIRCEQRTCHWPLARNGGCGIQPRRRICWGYDFVCATAYLDYTLDKDRSQRSSDLGRIPTAGHKGGGQTEDDTDNEPTKTQDLTQAGDGARIRAAAALEGPVRYSGFR